MPTDLEILCEHIRSQMGYKWELGADIDLFQQKVLDSFNIVELALFIQDRFHVELEAEDLVRANLATLSSMIALIEKRKATNAQ